MPYLHCSKFVAMLKIFLELGRGTSHSLLCQGQSLCLPWASASTPLQSQSSEVCLHPSPAHCKHNNQNEYSLPLSDPYPNQYYTLFTFSFLVHMNTDYQGKGSQAYVLVIFGCFLKSTDNTIQGSCSMRWFAPQSSGQWGCTILMQEREPIWWSAWEQLLEWDDFTEWKTMCRNWYSLLDRAGQEVVLI